jgi:hypothetical protein
MSEITFLIGIHAYAIAESRRYGFNRVPIRVAIWAFVVDKMVLEQVFPPPSS